MRNTLTIDIETYSSTDLLKSGVYRYAEAPDFEILLFGYAFDDEEIQVIDLTQDILLPDEVMLALSDSQVLKTAFNAAFERICLETWLGLRLPPEQWSCTAVLARHLGLPASLEAVGKVMNLDENFQKAQTGKALISFFSKPCKPTKVNGQRTRNLPEHDPNKWQEYVEYNRQDVVAEREIRKRLLKFSVIPSEQAVEILDQKINDRGVNVDTMLVENAIRIDDCFKAQLFEQAQEHTGLENPNSLTQLKDWIESEAGITVESLAKESLETVKEEANNAKVSALLDIRAGLANTSTGKYSAITRTVCEDGRIRGLTQFYGASRTGRWAGRLVQMQNLPRGEVLENSQELDLARQLVLAGDGNGLEMLYSNVPGVLSQLIRTAFVPKPGCVFVVADFTAIEAVILAWLADEKWRLDVFDTHGKIYEASAEKMFNLPAGSVTKGSPERQKGKIAELALGYGGSVGALTKMGALNMGLKEHELKPLVKAWRAANKAITKFWWDSDEAAKETLRTRAVSKMQYGLAFRKQGPLLRLRLPSGRELTYVKPAIRDGNITYEGTIQTSGGWGRIDSYGPKLVENIVQATARDCLAEAMLKIEKAGLPIVFHVHDEIICEVPETKADEALAQMLAIMSEKLPWAWGLNLKADGFIAPYYRKD